MSQYEYQTSLSPAFLAYVDFPGRVRVVFFAGSLADTAAALEGRHYCPAGTAFACAAVPLPQHPTLQDEFLRVRVRGVYRHDKEIHVGQYHANVFGYRVLTPLSLPDGRVILINRGWVPTERKSPDTRAQGQLSGVQTVEGILRVTGRKGWFAPPNDMVKNVWFWYDLPALRVATGLPLEPMMLDQLDYAPPGGYPVAGSAEVKILNDHLQYAITWFLLAIAVAVIWFVYHRQQMGGVNERRI